LDAVVCKVDVDDEDDEHEQQQDEIQGMRGRLEETEMLWPTVWILDRSDGTNVNGGDKIALGKAIAVNETECKECYGLDRRCLPMTACELQHKYRECEGGMEQQP
jgi:hypothetical protein